jgi:hypothetical protein
MTPEMVTLAEKASVSWEPNLGSFAAMQKAMQA